MNRPAIVFGLAVLFVVALVYAVGPGLMRDISLRNQQFVPAQAAITGAKCKTHWFVYTSCDVSYRAASAPQQAELLHYSFLGPVGEKSVRAMRPINDQNTVVADIGINKLGNRIALFAIALFGFASLGFFSMRKMMTA